VKKGCVDYEVMIKQMLNVKSDINAHLTSDEHLSYHFLLLCTLGDSEQNVAVVYSVVQIIKCIIRNIILITSDMH